MVVYTFKNCSGLTGYVPSSMYTGVTSGSDPEDAFLEAFSGCTNMNKTCPTGTTKVTTGYEQYWDGHVACVAQ